MTIHEESSIILQLRWSPIQISNLFAVLQCQIMTICLVWQVLCFGRWLVSKTFTRYSHLHVLLGHTKEALLTCSHAGRRWEPPPLSSSWSVAAMPCTVLSTWSSLSLTVDCHVTYRTHRLVSTRRPPAHNTMSNNESAGVERWIVIWEFKPNYQSVSIKI